MQFHYQRCRNIIPTVRTNLKKGSFLLLFEIILQDIPKPYNHLMFIMVATIVMTVLSKINVLTLCKSTSGQFLTQT
jgi:hypothetical protein